MGLSLRAIWKIMRSSGHNISYETFRRHVYKLGYKKVIEK
jgi:transposase-like protein